MSIGEIAEAVSGKVVNGDNFDKIVFNVYSKEALEIYENFI